MKKILFLLFIILNLQFATIFAQQTTLDSLKQIIATSKQDTNKVKTLNIIVNEYQKINIDTSLIYAEQSLELASQLNYKKGMAVAYRNIGITYKYLGKYKQTLDFFNKALKINRKIGDNKGIATNLGNIGIIYYDQNNYTKALKYYTKALKVSEEINYKEGIAKNFINIGVLYENQNNYTKALEYYLQSLKIFEELGEKDGIAINLGNIGIIYKNQSNYTKALEYSKRALEIYEEIANKKGIGNNLENIGIVYENQGNYQKALEYYKKALKINKEVGYKESIATNLENISYIYFNQSNYTKALEYYKKALEVYKEIADKEGIAINLQNIGIVYENQSNYAKALEYYEQALKTYEEIGNKDGIAENFAYINTVKNNHLQSKQNIEITYKISKEYKQDERFKSVSNKDLETVIKNEVPENTIETKTFQLLKPGYLISNSNNKKIIYDFLTERIITIENNNYDIVPLYHIINYRVMEFQNRRMITGALEAGGMKDALGGMFNLESLFGFEGDPNNFKKEIKVKKEKGGINYIYKKETVVSVKFSDTKINDIDMFKKFLIYNTTIHPVIIKLIAENGIFPKTIDYKYLNIANICNVKYEMTDIHKEEQSVTKLISLENLTVYKSKDDKVKSFINEVYSQKLENKTKLIKLEDCLAESDKYIKKKQYFDALLTLFEYLLQNGIQPTEGMKKALKYVEEDSDMKTFITALNSGNSKEAINKSIELIEKIDQTKYDKGYILNIFLANKYTAISSSKDIEYFYKALKVNSTIAGAYKDLGQSYAMKYDFEYAWKCYDIGLLINENNPMYKSIIDYKTMFKNDFPIYFK